jgi:hypothetical protein
VERHLPGGGTCAGEEGSGIDERAGCPVLAHVRNLMPATKPRRREDSGDYTFLGSKRRTERRMIVAIARPDIVVEQVKTTPLRHYPAKGLPARRFVRKVGGRY